MNPKFADLFAIVAGGAVVMAGAWWMMSRRATAAPAASSDAWFDQWYYAGKPVVIDARDAWAASVGLTPTDANGVSQAELMRNNPFLLAGL